MHYSCLTACFEALTRRRPNTTPRLRAAAIYGFARSMTTCSKPSFISSTNMNSRPSLLPRQLPQMPWQKQAPT